jgi:molybdopterin converting factor small subunit
VNKTVRLRYFAILREQRGLGEETVVTAASTAAELYDELRARHGFTLSHERLRVAFNDDLKPWTAQLRDGDTLVFIPPVAGG